MGGGGELNPPPPNPAPFFSMSLRTSNDCICGAIVNTFAWRTAVDSVVEVG